MKSEHGKAGHFKNNSFKCFLCRILFGSEAELETHIQSDHGHVDDKTEHEYSCTFCDEDFTDFVKLIAHIKASHKKRNECELSDKTGAGVIDWKKNNPEVAALIENCSNCSVSSEDRNFTFALCDIHRGDFTNIYSNLKETFPNLIE